MCKIAIKAHLQYIISAESGSLLDIGFPQGSSKRSCHVHDLRDILLKAYQHCVFRSLDATRGLFSRVVSKAAAFFLVVVYCQSINFCFYYLSEEFYNITFSIFGIDFFRH